MSAVDKILEMTQFTEEIDGVEFKLRLITAEIAARVIGSKTLGLMRSGSKSDLPDGAVERTLEGYLKACMVSPKLGDSSDPETDTISVDDLGEFGTKILTVVFERSGFERLGNSNVSSEDTKGET